MFRCVNESFTLFLYKLLQCKSTIKNLSERLVSWIVLFQISNHRWRNICAGMGLGPCAKKISRTTRD